MVEFEKNDIKYAGVFFAGDLDTSGYYKLGL